MKILKKMIITVLALCIVMLCALSTACSVKNAEVLGMDVYPVSQSFRPGYSLGVAFKYGIQNAEIAMDIHSEDSELLFEFSEGDKNDIKDIDKYEKCSVKYKKIVHSDDPVYYVNTPVFQIRPIVNWWHKDAVEWYDYVSFIARKDGKVTGYAVIYFWSGTKVFDYKVFNATKGIWVNAEQPSGYGEVLADKEVSNMSEEEVKVKIKSIIDKHKN